METKANYTLIGAFTLAVLLSVFGFVYWFSRGGESQERITYKIMFEGPVSGLRTGAVVNFNGIRVGEVTDLKLEPADPRKVVAKVALDTMTPVRADTRVTLEYQGLTGIAAVSLRGGSSASPALSAPEGEVPMLFADPSAVQDLLDGARQIMGRAETILTRVDKFIVENEAPFGQIVRNVESFSTVLGNNSKEIDTIIKDVAAFTTQLNSLAARLDKVMAGIEDFTGSNVGEGVFSEVAEAARAVKELAVNLDKRTGDISASVGQFTGSGLRDLQALASDGRKTLAEIERAIRNFDKNPQRVITGGGARVPEYR